MDTKVSLESEVVSNGEVSDFGIFKLEQEIFQVGEGVHSAAAYADARDTLVKVIAEICHLSGMYTGANLERVLGKVESATSGHRIVAILLIRCMAIDGLLPVDDEYSPINRKILSILESHASDLMKWARVEKQQNFEKIKIIKTLHGTICNHYSPLSHISGTLNEIATYKSSIVSCLRHKR